MSRRGNDKAFGESRETPFGKNNQGTTGEQLGIDLEKNSLTGGSKPQSQVGFGFLDLNFNSRRQTKKSKFARHTSAIVNSSVLRHILTKRQRLRQEGSWHQ